MFINGLKQNSSIKELYLRGVLFTENSIGRVGHEILKVYQENNNLTTLRIEAQFSRANQVIANTLKKCTNLKVIDLSHCRLRDQQLLEIVRSLKGNHVIEELNLSNLRLHGIGPCQELATLLRDPDCNLHTLNLEHNYISNEYESLDTYRHYISNKGLIAIANGLVNNTKFKRLCVDRKSVDQDVEATFSRLSFDASTSDEVEQIVFSRLSCGALCTNDTAPPASTCWICLDSGPDKDGKPLVRECSCRGSDAYVHISCKIGHAQQKTKINYESQPIIESHEHAMKFREPWEKCPHCEQYYDDKGTLPRELATAFVAFVEENYADNIPYILEALFLKLEAFNMARRHGIECVEAGSKLLSLIDQLKEEDPPPTSRGRILDIESHVYNNLGSNYLNAGIYKESVRCFQKYLDLSKSLNSSLAIEHAEKNLALAKRRQQDQILQEKQQEAWKRVSMFVLGEDLTRHSTRAGDHIRDLLHMLLTTVKNGCCSDVPAGFMCGHCESSVNVIRISRAAILSICKLPLELNDDITRKELDQIRIWIHHQVRKFKRDSGDEIKAILPKKLSELITETSSTDSIPMWGEDDFALLLQRPSVGWFMQTNVLMTMGYKVVLVNFSDVARYAKRNLKVVYEDISLSLCPPQTEDDNANELNEAMDKSCSIKNGEKGSEQVKAGDDDDNITSPPSQADNEIPSPPSHADESADISRGTEQVNDVGTHTPESPKKLSKSARKRLKKREKQALLKQQDEALLKEQALLQEQLDEALFKQPPSNRDCPICFYRIPSLETGYRYQACCGKVFCSGCVFACSKKKDRMCLFCGVPAPNSEKTVERLNKRVEVGDAKAMYTLGCAYLNFDYGLPLNYAKALELWRRAGKLGSAPANYRIGMAHDIGDGVEVDEKKANHYYELAAMAGHLKARHNLGRNEEKKCNKERALKHYMIAVRGGCNDSLKNIKSMSMKGVKGAYNEAREDYPDAFNAYQEYLKEIKTPQRDEAAAYDDGYKYMNTEYVNYYKV